MFSRRLEQTPSNPFVKSRKLCELNNMANYYRKRPSEILDVDDPYTAYCFDEACGYIQSRINDGDVPVYRKKVKSLYEIYQQYEGGEG